MFPIGFFLILAGAWLVDSEVHGRPPLQTLVDILKDPGNMRTILDQNAGTVHDASSTVTPGAASASHNADIPNVPSGKLGGFVSYVEAQIGKPYRLGAEGPNAYDCSGLGWAAYRSIGVKIPRVTAGQILAGRHVSRKNLRPGDAVFPYPGHVFWVVGSGPNALCVEAPHTGEFVHYTNIYQFFTARRFVK